MASRSTTQTKDILVELDSAAIRCAAAKTALSRLLLHPDREIVTAIADMLPSIQTRLEELTGDIMDIWSVARAAEVKRQDGKAA